MDDRSYRDGCPPYCTCVDCANKQINKKPDRSFYSKNFIIAFILLTFIFIIFLIF